MAVPDARLELQIGGVWTDTNDDLLHGEGIRYSWGRRGEGSRTDPAAAAFSLRNPDGKYSSRNPNSEFFGQLGRNTPARLTHGGANVALVVPIGAAGRATTPDVAALDIVGDIDLRADLTAGQWAGTTATGAWEVMGKYTITGAQRSWMLLVQDDGRIQLRWSADGAALLFAFSTEAVPFGPGVRGAIRATLDVNNGAGGWSARFYTAGTMAGPFVQLGTTVVTAGVTSIFASTAPLEVGDVEAVGFAPVSREFHAVEVRSGLGGSAVANPVFSAQADGTTSFADAAGRTWTLAGSVGITSRRTRAVLEASEWSPQWGASGYDVTTPVVAAGILRRLGQGDKALASTLRRRIPAAGAPKAYWPLEEGSTATQAYSPVAGVAPLTVAGFEWGADSDLAGSAPLPRITDAASMTGAVPTYAATGQWMVACVYNLPTAPVVPVTLLEFTTTGTARRIVLDMDGAGNVGINGYSATGTTVFTAAAGATEFHGQWNRLEITAVETGGNTEFHLGWVVIGGTGYGPNSTVAATAGTVTSINTVFSAAAADLRIGHLGVFSSSTTTVYIGGDTGWNGESASARMIRLTAEEGVPSAALGQALTLMGPQRPDALLDLLGEIESADDGILYEDRERAGLVYRARTTLYNQTPKLVIPYGQLAPPLKPVDDDRHLRNDRIVTRPGGSSARAVLTSGPLSVAAPPAGVGTYDDSQTMNVKTDAQCEDLAYWLLHRGTWDESRYPSVRIYLHKYPALIPAVSALRPGDIIRITDLPPWLPPGPLDLMVEGGDEEMKTLAWTITLACSPAGPWTVAVANDDGLGKADTAGSTLGAAATSSATTLVVHTTQTADGMSPLWTEDGAEYPFDLKVGGEVVTATAATTLAADTFTRTVAAGGWGTSSDGHSYTVTGGPASDRSVAATYGLITLNATPTTNRYMVVAETCRDCDIRASVAFSATATGGSLVAALIARWSSFTDHYRLRVEGTTAGGITLTVARANTVVGSSVPTGVTYTPGSVIEVRMRIIGDRVLGRAWATGALEPLTWHIDETITSSPITDGQVALAGVGLTGNTNVTPEIRFHDWVVETPQRITVTRSTNGISKAQLVGEAISLAQPAIVAY
ncbi:hypothetical protein ABT024_06810 [Streptomyces sp. NPDC002812]|uniref:hypothetical protein n=1 Tax=Streptomyces sp. NPDC002812 TaxID=3154434 RepID=UPI00332D308D